MLLSIIVNAAKIKEDKKTHRFKQLKHVYLPPEKKDYLSMRKKMLRNLPPHESPVRRFQHKRKAINMSSSTSSGKLLSHFYIKCKHNCLH